jgi:hypothetical protein
MIHQDRRKDLLTNRVQNREPRVRGIGRIRVNEHSILVSLSPRTSRRKVGKAEGLVFPFFYPVLRGRANNTM